MTEIWKKIKYTNNYEISNYGNLRSITHVSVNCKNVARTLHGRNIKCFFVENEYVVKSLRKSDGKKKTYKIHRLVAEHFLKKVYGKEHVNHKDGVKHNNNVKNLEWCTPSENTLHAIRLGLMKYPVRSKKNG